MKSNLKRFMGIVLTVFVILTMLPATTFAEDSVALTAADSPDYVKTADGALELLYNGDTITGADGRVYAGFIIAKDYQDNNNRKGVGFYTTETLYDGSVNPDKKSYGVFKFNTSYPVTVKEALETVVLNSLPKKIADNLYMNTWSASSSYWLSEEHPHVTAKTMARICLPSGENMLRHGVYLKTQMDNNPNPYQTGIVTYKGALVRDTSTYSTMLYDPATDSVKSSGFAARYGYGSTFPAMYLALDAFAEVKMDIESMGDNVKALLAEKLIKDDFVGSVYTDAELDQIGIVAVPEEPTPVHSPNYLKFVTEDGTIKEYLYNDTITQDGKTYIGLIGTWNMSSNSSGRIGANLYTVQESGVDYFGDPLPVDSNWYVGTGLLKEWHNGKYDDIHTKMSWIPTSMQPYLLKYNYDCAANSMHDGYSLHTLRTIGKLTITSKDEVDAHLTYLKSKANYGSSIATRSGHGGNGYYVYSLANSQWETPTNYHAPGGSTFVRMYVDADMFKTVKVDVVSMRSNVKAMMRDNFVRGELEGIYTEAELDKMGIESFKFEEKPTTAAGSSFVYDGQTFYYLNEVKEYNGKKYFKIFDKKQRVTWSNDACYLVSERPEGGLYLTVKEKTTTGTDLQDHATNLSIFGDYKISSDYEWRYGNVYYNGVGTAAYVKGSISLPSESDYNFLLQQGETFPDSGSQIITSSFFVYENGTNRYHVYQNKIVNNSVSYVADGDYYKGKGSARYNYVTYISEDFFKENEVDITTMGEVMLNAIKNNFTRDDLAGWNESTLDALFNSGYTGEGLGLVAYKTGADSVSVVINNNDTAASTGTKLIVVAAYSENDLEDVRLVNVTGTIPANSYTTKLPVTLDVDGAEIVEIKVMLWDSVFEAKPLAEAITLK